MIKDITFGQFFPGKSFVHKTDARAKLIAEVCFAVLLFLAKNYYALVFGAVFSLFCFLLSGLKPVLLWKSIKPILPVIIFSGFLNVFFIKGETVLFNWKFITLYNESLLTAGFMILRIISLIIAMSLLTYTTSPIDITDAIENLFSPLKRFGLPVHEFAMMMTIAMRFIPTLTDETDKIISAQKARGANLDTGSIIKRAKALAPVLIPLFISAFRRAYELALAMECRCYRGGEGRTKLKKLSFGWRDPVMLFTFAGAICAVSFLNWNFSDSFKV